MDETPVQCSFCSTEMKVTGLEMHKEIVYNGGVNWFTLGYGSRFDGEQWLIAICDECLEKCKPIKTKEYL